MQGKIDLETLSLINLIRRKGGRISARELYRNYSHKYNCASAKEALNDLESNGYGGWETITYLSGGRPRKDFILYDEFIDEDENEEVSDSQVKTETIQALHDLQVIELKSKISDLNDKYQHALHLLKESNDNLTASVGLRNKLKDHPIKHIKIEAESERGESTAVLVASDWHIEEKIDPKTVDGINEYNPKIAEERIKKFFQRGLSLVEMARTRSKIDKLILAVLGDLITNNIHEDLAESNYLSPTEASLEAYRLLCGGIDFLLANGKFDKILVPCCHGNHDRTVKKPRIHTMAKNSYAWLIYQLVAEKYVKEDRVDIVVADGYFNFVDVYGKIIRFHHGDDVRYNGGVGGIEIPLNKSIAQWNKFRRADIDVLGHWHTRKISRDFVVNGSVVGFSPYSLHIKASYEPPCQSFFLMHPTWGKTVEAPIFLD